MVLRFLKAATEPIAIDFGYATIKILQLSDSTAEGPRRILAAACAEIPLEIRHDPEQRDKFLIQTIPTLLRKGKFGGRVAVCSIPAWKTFVQHMRVPKNYDGPIRQQLLEQLQSTIACDPENLTIRHVDVCEVNHHGQIMSEIICFCLSRDSIMRQINLLKRCKVLTGSLQAEAVAANEAFGHLYEPEATPDAFKNLYRREGDDQITTAYVDVGASCVKVMIAHGTKLVFSKVIPFGGRHFDHRVATALRCDLVEAYRQRREWMATQTQEHHPPVDARHMVSDSAPAMVPAAAVLAQRDGGHDRNHAKSGSTTTTETGHERRHDQLPPELVKVADMNADSSTVSDSDTSPEGLIQSCLDEIWGHLADELQMCARYHSSLFSGRPIDRLFLMGGESRNPALAQKIGRAMNVPTYHADPLGRLKCDASTRLFGLDPETDYHGWAVPVGLCYLSGE